MRKMIKTTSPIFLVLLLTGNLFAQVDTSDLMEFLKEMKLEMQEIRSLLERLPLPKQPTAPPTISIKDIEFKIGDNPVLGNGDARLILVEFTDYQCTFCGRYVRDTFPQILKEYVDEGILMYTVIDQPLPMHQHAEKAARAAHCAAEQGKYWEIHKLMMSQQDSLNDPSSYARTLNLNIPEFETCLATGKYGERVQNNIALARELGMSGVPGFVIGLVDSQDPGSVKGVSTIRGAQPFTNFQKEFASALAAVN